MTHEMIIINIIERAKIKLVELNVEPPYSIWLSPKAHDFLVAEMELMDGKKRARTKVFEVMGIKVEIDPLCPQGGAYMKGEKK